jgi:hypothetical protein
MGIKKTLLCVGGLMLASGGPITVFSGSDMLSGMKRHWFSGPTATATADLQQPAATPTHADISRAGFVPVAADNAMPMPSLAEALRFDVSVRWVMQRWPRVSTGLPYLQLQGYRVPLVTGTRISDLAGSLTYYFGAQQQVQRITFRGTTGDPNALAAFLTGRYGFARRLTNDPGVVLYEAVNSSNQPVGSLRIRSAPVVKASQPYTRFEIDLVMDRAE